MEIRLDKRLSAIYDMIPEKSVVADIGCDHAHLSCALIKTGRASRVFACEANLGPLLRAERTIRENCLSGKIDTVLTNGLNDLPHEAIDTFVIAGMGGDLIGEIMLTHMWTRDSRFIYILNPMTKDWKLRKLLYDNGFSIKKERCVISDNKVYIVMRVIYTDIVSKFDEVSFYCGSHLNSSDISSTAYIDKVIKRIEKKISGIKKTGKAEIIKYYEDLLAEIRTGRQRGKDINEI